jgi:hypothetical protein
LQCRAKSSAVSRPHIFMAESNRTLTERRRASECMAYHNRKILSVTERRQINGLSIPYFGQAIGNIYRLRIIPLANLSFCEVQKVTGESCCHKAQRVMDRKSRVMSALTHREDSSPHVTTVAAFVGRPTKRIAGGIRKCDQQQVARPFRCSSPCGADHRAFAPEYRGFSISNHDASVKASYFFA